MRRKLMFLLSFLFLAAIGNAVLTVQLESHEDQKFKWIQSTHAIARQSDQLLSYIKDVETGQRGYLLTRVTSYLKPYHGGLIKARRSLAELSKLKQNDPLQQKRLQSVKEMMEQKFALLAEGIESLEKNNKDNNKAIALVKKDNDNNYMENIRHILYEFKQTESVLLAEKANDFKNHRRFILGAIIIEIVFFVLLAFTIVLFLNKNLFSPLYLLISNIRKMEQGTKVKIVEVDANDEMGYLLSRFFKMYEKIEERTRQLTYTASHDELTGLNNRVNLYSEIENAINAQRESDTHFAVLFLDLDKFKYLNDTFGHDAGDFILKETAGHLIHSVRGHDVVFRVGGDEFVILMNDVDLVADLKKIANKLLKTTSEPVIYQGHELQIALSIGIAMSTSEITSSEQIVTYADVAMYEAKHDKSSSYKFFEPGMLKRSSDV